MDLLLFVGGLAALVAGANALVRGASKLALSFGISPLVVGLTIVAFGTSAPELAVSVGAALKGQTDIAAGNVAGSNIFNVLFILGASALIAPLVVHIQLIRQEVLTGREIARWEGALFVLYYAAYVAYLILAAQQHDALPAFSAAMAGFVVPLTVVTLVVVTVRRGR
jgi:cation:H+ antiporter